MSIRRRQWYTSKQIREWAARLAKAEGEPEDAWQKYRDAAQELTTLLRRARPPLRDPEALKALKGFPPKEAWVVDYVDQSGTRCFQTFERKKEADDYHSTVKVEIRQGIHTPISKSPTVAEAAEIWIKRVIADGREPTTVRQYRQHVDLHIVPRIGRLKLAELSPAKVELFRDDLLEHLERPTARKVLTSLKSLLKAAKHAHVAADVSIGSEKRNERKLEVGRDIPMTAEIKRLIDATRGLGDPRKDSKLRALLLTAALTGLRASELRGLRWKDIDFDSGELHVRQRADRYCEIGSPKGPSGINGSI
jgi:integrase